MSYQEAIEAAGASIIKFKEFGSYQGDWYALVEFNGEVGWIQGSYGSCSRCDAFQAEFGWNDSDSGCEEHLYHKKENCKDCQKKSDNYNERLAEFGSTYLTLLTQEEVEAHASKYSDWSFEDGEALSWLKANSIRKAE